MSRGIPCSLFCFTILLALVLIGCYGKICSELNFCLTILLGPTIWSEKNRGQLLGNPGVKNVKI